MALDEATVGLLKTLDERLTAPTDEVTPAQAREFMDVMADILGEGPAVERVYDDTVAVDGGTIPVRVYLPSVAPPAVIVFFHGGGWVIGNIPTYDTTGRTFAALTGCAVVLPDYRLAPEHRYPTPAEDCWATFRWTQEHLEEITGRDVPAVIAGDSAGGNLAAVVAQRAKAEGGPQPLLQILMCPVIDADLDTPSYADPDNQLILTRDVMAWFWDQYVPDHDARRNPDASPLRAADLSGLPPAVVVTAEYDVLRDEGEAYAQRLRAAGVAVRQRRFPGQMHGFVCHVGVLPGSDEALAYVKTAIEEHLSDSRRAPTSASARARAQPNAS